jgi:hypothetical protein
MPEVSNKAINQNEIRNVSSVKLLRDREISIPTPDSEREMAIRCIDWKRLEKKLGRIGDTPKDFSVLYGIVFGFCGSAALTIIPLMLTKDLPAWVMPTYIIAVIASFLLGCFIFYFNRIQRNTVKTTISDLLEDVKDIGSNFPLEQIQNGEIIDTAVVNNSNSVDP